jgi:NAD(P)H-hydrate epimerase
VVRRTPLPTAIDADGLNALAGRLDLLRDAAGPRVLTPHPGEMARLIGCGTAEVQADRIAVARRFAAEHRVTLVLKGARTVVAVPDGPAWINPTGNPGLASGGSGDVLAGILGGLLAQGSAPADAAVAAAFVHGAAADRIAGDSDGRGLAARDLLEALPPVLRDLLAHSTIPC